MALTPNTELLASCYIRTDRDMTKLTGAFCIFQTLLSYLDIPDSAMYNKVESNGFRASAFSHRFVKKKCNRKKWAFPDGMGLSLTHIVNQQKSHQCIKLSENVAQKFPS